MGQGSSRYDEDKVHIFGDSDFKGDPITTTDPVSVNNVKQKGLPTSIGSLVVPSKCEVHLFRDSNYKGHHRYYRGPARISKNDHGSDITSSLIVARHVGADDEPKEKQAILYYVGRNGIEGVLVEAPLEIGNVSKLGIPNNSLTQVKLGSQVSLNVYDEYKFEGTSSTLSGPYTGGLGDLDKKASSFKLSLGKNLQEVTPITSPTNIFSSWIFWVALIIIVLVIGWLIYSSRRVSPAPVEVIVPVISAPPARVSAPGALMVNGRTPTPRVNRRPTM